MIDQWLETLSALLEHNVWFAPLLALLAGVVTAFTPCSLTSIPLILGYLDGTGGSRTGRAFRISLIFALGMTATFAVAGIFASLLGKLLHHLGPWWYAGLGILMVLMALQIFDVINFIPSSFAHGRSKRRGYAGAFLAGTVGGLFASHCALPVLVVLLAMVAEKGDISRGILLLLLYSLGHSVLVLSAGTSLGLVTKWTEGHRYHKLSRLVRILLGAVVLLLAAYMFFLAVHFTGH